MNPLVWAALWLVAAGPQPPPLTYQLEEVRSKVVLTHAGEERRAQRGELAEAGDELRTGMFARTILLVPERASRFEIFSSTRVRLAGPEPGVLLVLERGRLKALFDALLGSEERWVATPGAILAVRGTRYGVEVDAAGNGTLAVFAGTVEVRPREAALPAVLVRAGELCAFGPGHAPMRQMMPSGMTENGWGHGAMHGLEPGGGRSGMGMEPRGPQPGHMGHPPPSGMSGGR